MYVTDDEAMAVALDAAEEATADTSPVSHTEEGEEGVPTKEPEAAATDTKATQEAEPTKEPEDTHATIQNILNNMEPVTEDEVKQKRYITLSIGKSLFALKSEKCIVRGLLSISCVLLIGPKAHQ